MPMTMKHTFAAALLALAVSLPAQADMFSSAVYSVAQNVYREAERHAAIQPAGTSHEYESRTRQPSGQPVNLQAEGTVEVAFSPYGGVTAATVRFINEARTSILVAAYGLTSNPIGKALVDAKKRGVDVRVVVDKDYNGRRDTANSVVGFLASNGIPVRIDTAVAIQHNKVLIIDSVSVQNGSFNFTKAAEESNAENITIHRNFPQLAQVYTKNWMQLWNQSQDFRGGY